MKLLAVLIALALVATGFFLYRSAGPRSYRLRMSAGDPLGHRHVLAGILTAEAAPRNLKLELRPNSGSEESLNEVAAGRLDVALVQGGLDPRPEIRQVAVLVAEPLHLLVRPELLKNGIGALRGARLNLSSPASGTRRLAVQTLELMGLKPADYRDEGHSYAELERMPAAELPDAVFVVSPLPSHFAEFMITQRGYELIPLPFGQAMSVRDRSLQDVVIPAYMYSVARAVPPEPVHTVAPWLSLIAHRNVPDEAVIRLLETIFDGDFALHAELQGLDADEVVRRREFPLHPGTSTYLNRNQPLITGEFIEGVENLRSFLVSGLVAGFLAWRWYRRRADVGFERYMDDVTEIELGLFDRQRSGRLDPAAAHEIEERLSRLKSDALEQFQSGKLRGDEMLDSFLTHVADVRNCLHSLTARE